MPATNRLFKYYLFFGVLFIGAIAALTLTLSTAGNARTDKATSDKINEIGPKLEDYISQKNLIPATLDDAGINSVPSTVTYTKIDDSQYKLCANYKSGSTGYDAGWSSLVTGALDNRLGTTSPSSQGNSYLDTYSLTYSYKKGQNCQTVTPYLNSTNLDNSGNVSSTDPNNLSANQEGGIAAKCGNNGSSYELKDITTVKSVDASQGVLTLDTTNAKLTDKNANPVKSLPNIKYDDLTAIYGKDCKVLGTSEVNALSPGSAVTVYLFIHDNNYADQIEL